ncbi:MAG TPA: DNA replication/repair protein RecF [Bacillota bacterium]|nr:DNA replication/repair protein RecF [Bacillota bacterium]HPF42089.1 DNA replication/repair protein RecF [Bacillota bacterium]HPJ85811.1 DNA replication/repair protein RecF [Bacillota bacterium]HPQ61536.1 DNA replication/repair protein RecF [Bacillota bacterium]HRX91347.1 DNA replication/repair protein RecF [Candidatus Izemoplasmatales bacterium]
MKIDKVTLTNFRNYHKQTLELGSGIHFIIGANGEGKTNFLEALYVLALAKSYKAEDSDLIRFSADFARIQATIEKDGRKFELTMIITEIGKKAMRDSQEIKRLSDYIGNLNIVSFLPEDIVLIKGAPRDRRYYVDVFLGQIDKDYLNELTIYKHILKQRNELLKKLEYVEKPDYTLLDVITEQLASSAEKISQRRVRFQEEINGLIDGMYKRLSDKDEKFSLVYQQTLPQKEAYGFLKEKYRQDIMQGATGYGPHRDDYVFMLDEFAAGSRASQGEQRMMVLSLNMGLAELVKETRHETPVFLLDDVFSELDETRQNRLLEYVATSGIQTIVTTTGLGGVKDFILKQAHVFHVNKGYIKEEY